MPDQGVLPLVIDASQSAFFKGRGMLDSILAANEVVEEWEERLVFSRWTMKRHMTRSSGTFFFTCFRGWASTVNE